MLLDYASTETLRCGLYYDDEYGRGYFVTIRDLIDEIIYTTNYIQSFEPAFIVFKLAFEHRYIG